MTTEPLARSAMSELSALLALSDDKTASANAFQEFCKLGLPVIVCDVDPRSAVGAGDFIVSFQVNEALVRHMAAARAGQGKNLCH